MPCPHIHANNPKRLAAIKRGKSRFKSDLPCTVNPAHGWRWVVSGGCADCADARNLAAKVQRKHKPKPPKPPTPSKALTVRAAVVEKSDAKLAMIGEDINDRVNLERLAKTTDKFLRLLAAEKLHAIRSGAGPHASND